MKILQVGSSLHDWGGIERYVAYLSETLIALGHTVDVVCPSGSPLDQQAPGNHINLSLTGQFEIGKWNRFREIARAGKYDIIHVHFSPDFVVPVRATRPYYRGRIVMTRHLVQRWNGFKRWAYGSTFDRIIAVSEASRRALVDDSRFPGDQVVTAYAGCHALTPKLTVQDARAQLKILDSEIAIGFFGRLVIEKGVDVAIEALKQLPSGTHFHVFGDGPDRSRLVDMSEGLPVTFHGMIADVTHAMQAMDIIVIPSWWAEAFPYAVLEALSMGKPIVASNVGGIPEQIESGQDGLLVEPRNADALAEALLTMIQEPAMAAKLGAAAKAKHAREFTLEAFGKRIEAVYQGLLG